MQILNAQEDNAGRYSCVATNEAGEMIKHYEVKVYSKSQKNFSPCSLTFSILFFFMGSELCIFVIKLNFIKREVEISIVAMSSIAH